MKLEFRELMKAPMMGVNAYRWMEICFDDLNPSKEDVCLDIGCGGGHIEFLLSKSVKKIIGIDLSEIVVKILNENSKLDNVEFYAINATKEAPKEFLNRFDKCICIDVMEHIENPEKLLEFVSLVLKVGGELVMTFPINNPHHGRNYFTKEKVYELFENTDLKTDIKIIKLGKWGLLASSIYGSVRKILKPTKEADTFDDTVCLPMMQNQKKIYNLYKWVLILLCKVSEGSYYEDESGNRVLIRAMKV